MQVTLKVLASTSIKRRKPWCRLAWIGNEQEELFLLGNHRLSILYLQSGKTKRKIAKLASFIKNCVVLNYTNNGSYLFGLLSSGNLFVWHKDTNVLVQIDGLVDLKAGLPSGDKSFTKVYASDDATQILVTSTSGTSSPEVFLWHHHSDAGRQQQQQNTSGKWWHFATNVETSPLRLPRFCKNLSVDACFVKDGLLGECCLVAFVYAYGSAVHFVCLNVRWFPNTDVPAYRWCQTVLPLLQLSSDVGLVRRKGALVARWSHNGRLLATAVNQESSQTDNVVFLSPVREVFFISTLPKEYNGPRHLHRVCDLAWTHDDLFVVTINHLGSICLLSRLGEPLMFATQGCSMDLPAAYSLNIHPFIFVRQQRVVDDDSNSITADILKQRFSLCCHPRLPVFLCSDGYMVTCLQFPYTFADTLKFAGVYLRQASKDLNVLRKLLQLSNETLTSTESPALLASSRRKSSVHVNKFDVSNKIAASISGGASQLTVEPTSESDSSHLLSEKVLHHYSVFGEYESGTLVFGTQARERVSSAPTKNVTFQELLCDVKREAKARLLCVWGVLVTVSDTWTTECETLSKKASHLLVKLCASLLSVQNNESLATPCLLPSFLEAVLLANSWLILCVFITSSKSLMLVVLAAVKLLIRKMLKVVLLLPPELWYMHSSSVFRLLEFVEKTVVKALSGNAGQLTCVAGLTDGFSVYNASARFVSGPQSSVSGSQLVNKKRLLPIWRHFYENIVEMYSKTSKRNDLTALLGTVQQKLQKLGVRLYTEKPQRKIGQAETIVLSAPKNHDQAVSIWKEKVQSCLHGTDAQSIISSARILHRILYTQLGGYHLNEAVQFIYWLLTRDRQNNNVESGLCHVAVRRTVKSFARFMTAYFLDRDLFVYPLDHPHDFPSPHRQRRCQEHRVIPVCRRKLVQCLNASGVAYHWTPDVAVSLFLSAGYVVEAARLSQHLGDWKTAYTLFYVARAAAPARKEVDDCLQSLLTGQLRQLIDPNRAAIISAPSGASSQLSATLEDWFLAGALCDVDAVSSTLKHLIGELHSLVRQLPLIVPADVYLPYPPPYCPQLNQQNQAKTPVSLEENCRNGISRIIQVFIAILQTLRCTIPFVHCYLTFLHHVTIQMAQTKTSVLQDWPLMNLLQKLKRHSTGCQVRQQSECNSTLDRFIPYFRELCGICWFLHARDKMNLSLRKFRQQLAQSSKTAPPARFCLATLHWSMHMIPFAESSGWRLDVYHLIVSVLLEAPRDRRTSYYLARCFPEMSCIPADLDHRISRLLNAWRGTLIKVPSNRRQLRTTKTLSVIHLDQCKEVKTCMENVSCVFGKFEKIAFDRVDHLVTESTHSKVRAYELEQDYFLFLVLMLDVAIIKDLVDAEEPPNVHIPLLKEFRVKLHRQHLNFPLLPLSFAEDKRRHAVHDIFVDAAAFQEDQRKLPMLEISDVKLRSASLSKPGLFRSLSLNELKFPESEWQKSEKQAIDSSVPLRSLATKLKHRVKSLTNLESARNNVSEVHVLEKCSSLLSVCDTINVEEMLNKLAKSESEMHEMVKMFTWLVRWTKRDHFTGNQTKAQALVPRMKINLTLNQLLFAVYQASCLLQRTETSEESISNIDQSPKIVPPSTPLPESKKFLSLAERKSTFLSGTVGHKEPIFSGNQNDEPDSQLNGEIHPEGSKDSSSDISSLTPDSSFANSDVDIWSASHVPSASEDFTVVTTTTSRWTNTSQNLQNPMKKPFNLKSISPTTPVSRIPHSSANTHKLPVAGSQQQSPAAPRAVYKDFFCGDSSVFGHDVIDAGIQVHEESLLENAGVSKVKAIATKYLQNLSEENMQNGVVFRRDANLTETVESRPLSQIVDGFNRRHGRYEEARHESSFKRLPIIIPEMALDGICSQQDLKPHIHPSTPENNRQLTTDISITNHLTKQKVDELEDLGHIRLLRLPAEKESSLLDRLIQSPVPLTQEMNKPPQIPALLSLEQERQFYPLQQPNKYRCHPKLLSPEEICAIQARWNPGMDTKVIQTDPTEANLPKDAVTVPPLLHLSTQHAFEFLPASSKDSGLQRDSRNMPSTTDQKPIVLPKRSRIVQTNGKSHMTPMKSNSSQTVVALQKDASVSTEGQQMRNAATTTEVGSTKFTSTGMNTAPLTWSHQPADVVELTDSPRKLTKDEEVSSKQIILAQAMTQTEAAAKKQRQQRNACTNTAPQLDSGPEKTSVRPQIPLTQRECTTSEVAQSEKLEGNVTSAERSILDRFDATKKEAEILQTDVVDLKKMLERLDNLEKEGLLGKLFPNASDKQNDQVGVLSMVKEESKKQPENLTNEQHQQFSQHLDRDTNPISKTDLLEWMQKQRRKQQEEFLHRQESLRQAERQPFISDNSPVPNVALRRAEGQRRKRQEDMQSKHFELRKNDAVQLLQEIIHNERPALIRNRPNGMSPVAPVTSASQVKPFRNNSSKNVASLRGRKTDANETYILSRGGLKPVVYPSNKLLHTKSQPASPSRRILPPSNYSCPTSPKNSPPVRRPERTVKPTTYIERLQALQSPASKPVQNHTGVQRRLNDPEMHTHLVTNASQDSNSSQSRSSSCETLSQWIVPEEIQHLLYGDVLTLKTTYDSD